MYELHTIIPDVDVFLSLEPEELGAKMLFLMQARLRDPQHRNGLHRWNCLNELSPEYLRDSRAFYPEAKREQAKLAFCEAWSWLEAQGLVIPSPTANGSDGWSVLSRRALKFVDQSDVASFATARLLSRERLHRRIAQVVWSAFMRGEYDVAVLQAMKAVEVAVREASGLSAGDFGTDLMRKAFHYENGALTDLTVEKSERDARSALFSGAIGSYKNPHSHRDVNLDDPAEAAEIIMLANHLLRIVDARAAERAAPNTAQANA